MGTTIVPDLGLINNSVIFIQQYQPQQTNIKYAINILMAMNEIV